MCEGYDSSKDSLSDPTCTLPGGGGGPHLSQQLTHNQRHCIVQRPLHREASGLPAGGEAVRELETNRVCARWADPGEGRSREESGLLCGLTLIPGHGGLECQGQGPKSVAQTPRGVKQLSKCQRGREDTVALSDHGAACSPVSQVSQAMGGIGVCMSPLECLGCSRGLL